MPIVPPGATTPPAMLLTDPAMVPWPSSLPFAPTTTLPPSVAPGWAPSPTSSVPAEIVVSPVSGLKPSRMVKPVPIWFSAPVPEMLCPMICRLLRLRLSVPLSTMLPATEPLVPPAPRFSVAPLATVVRPVKMLAPVSVSVPPAIVRPPPVPPKPPSAIMPENVPDALVSVSVCAPSETPPAPDKVMIDAPAVVPKISNWPLSITFEESAIEPVPFSRKAAPGSIVVVPV